ncbi:uncharacterized protein FIESC28_04686 [Fusarium coffeatum]|uniref:Uncharacterized protein n=5 Tax=Fusarium incarnatum-equiseti species complex TaxID=450425 RepID=A0A395M675_9HYPO|nr:uncharacterized protein FIESC28_04686 [Fusarium coffeatum]XP_045984435.1 uncharacterized protein B0J16DRAFT_412974 [Fusarium flagelliforme]KAI1072288.1 hypothetical protein LB507_002745 [Fusarium sp. FIESC RH6]KAJ4010335.1 hypothetical protein NW766_008204 [Fusarium irregulare]KAJ4141360.1 hypothetical protein NW768_000571 [Fusarium equiseti]CEG04758.1 unnamed protein product [Fusarium clavum]KAH7188521.1 hypothetical protein B0J16DRAFT_412974 [Fusarium flagelliforme]
MVFGSRNNRTSEEELRGRSREPVPLMESKQRTNSYASEFSTSTKSTASSRTKASRSWFKPAPQPAQVNVHTYCGRHSSQFLFGGPSLADLARAMFGKD